MGAILAYMVKICHILRRLEYRLFEVRESHFRCVFAVPGIITQLNALDVTNATCSIIHLVRARKLTHLDACLGAIVPCLF